MDTKQYANSNSTTSLLNFAMAQFHLIPNCTGSIALGPLQGEFQTIFRQFNKKKNVNFQCKRCRLNIDLETLENTV